MTAVADVPYVKHAAPQLGLLEPIFCGPRDARSDPKVPPAPLSSRRNFSHLPCSAALCALSADIGSIVTKEVLLTVAAAGMVRMTKVRPMWQFVLMDGKVLFARVATEAWLRLLAAADDLCDPANELRRPDLRLQKARAGLTAELRDALASMEGAPAHGASELACLVEPHMVGMLNTVARDAKLPPIPDRVAKLPELPEQQKAVV